MRIRYILVILSFAAFSAVAALNICNKCGHENLAESAVCNHCSAELNSEAGGKRVQADVPSEEGEDGSMQFLPVELVNEEVALARKRMENKELELARLFFRNALAINSLTDPSDDGKRSRSLLKMIKQCENSISTVVRKCNVCNGDGRSEVQLETMTFASGEGKKTLGDNSGQVRSASKKCERCNGTGRVTGRATMEDLKYEAAKAASAYRELQLARKYEPLGNAWVSKSVIDDLTVRQKAMVMRTLVTPCESCSGFGRLDCRKCKGLGRTECRNSECRNGKVPGKVKSLLGNEAPLTGKCPDCNGSGTIKCSSCSGDGTVPCSKCHGSGESGKCYKCDARGYIECKKCGANGENRGAPCKYCGGMGESLCSSCGGEGHKK